MAIDTTRLRTRRAILMGALGGAVAAAAASVGRASPVAATNGQAVKVGNSYTATAPTSLNATGGATAFSGISDSSMGLDGSSTSGIGVKAASGSGIGLRGISTSGLGVYASSNSGMGVFSYSQATDQPALLGSSYGNRTGVQGYSAADVHPAPPPAPKTGVFGAANQDAEAVGVRGVSTTGRGAVFNGKLAQLRLKPSSATTHPASGLLGDLFLDKSGRLWLCKGATTWVVLG
jgi:hypothetical protein